MLALCREGVITSVDIVGRAPHPTGVRADAHAPGPMIAARRVAESEHGMTGQKTEAQHTG